MGNGSLNMENAMGETARKIDIRKIMSSLSKERPVFHSEDDFRRALSGEIRKEYREAYIEFEYCPQYELKKKIFFDIKIELDGKIYIIELKYKTLKQQYEYNGEVYNLKDHSAQDLGRYDYLKDIQRIEESLKLNIMKTFEAGYAVILTNDNAYKKDLSGTGYGSEQFSLYEGRCLGENKELIWSERVGPGTRKGREEPIKLLGNYKIHWENYFHEQNSAVFRYKERFIYCINEINKL